MIVSGDIPNLAKDFVSFVPFGVTLILFGGVTGIIFRLCIIAYEKKSKTA